MIPLLLSLTFGAGVYFLYDGLTRLPGEDAPPDRLRPLRELLIRAGLRDVSPRDLALLSLAAGIAGGLATQLVLGWGVVSLLVAGFSLCAPFLYALQRHDRRRAVVQAAVVDATASLRDSIRTGLSVQEALAALARGGPDILRPEFSALVRDLRFASFEEAISAMRDRLADPLFDVVATTLVLNDRLGGRNVSQVLD